MLYQWLDASNCWVLGIVLYFFAVPFIWLGRKIIEGKGYNVSYASNWGALSLIAMIGMGVTLLQHKPVIIPNMFGDTMGQVALLATLVLGMALLTLIDYMINTKQLMDIYHNLVVVPVLGTLVLLLGQVIWLNGSGAQIIIAAACILAWAMFLIVDIIDGRLNQREYLATHAPLLFQKLK